MTTLLVNANELNAFDKITLNKKIKSFHPEFVSYSLEFYTLNFTQEFSTTLIANSLKEHFPALKIKLKYKVGKRTVYTEL